MKTIFFILLFLLFSSTSIQAQWEIQLDLDNFIWLDRIHFINENRGWAIGGVEFGDESPYLYTTNGGENWYLYDYETIGSDIVFVNPDTGFIAAQNGIIRRTVNGGQTWTDIQTPATERIFYLFFVNEENGWAVPGSDSEGHILHTEDAGESWELQQVIYEYYSDIQCIYFINDSIGWACGSYLDITNNDSYTYILKTQDKGETWITQYSVLNQHYWFKDIYFTSELNGWAVGQKSSTNTYLILKTEDGGETWDERVLPELTTWSGTTREASIIYSIQFVNDTLGWLTCADEYDSGYILLTTDSGETWQQQYVNQNLSLPIFDICMVDENTGWAVGYDFIYHTNNGDTIIVVDVENIDTKTNLVTISPNPTTGIFTVETARQSLYRTFGTVLLTITDITGKEIYRRKDAINRVSTFEINITNQAAGIYILTIQYRSNNQSCLISEKIVKY